MIIDKNKYDEIHDEYIDENKIINEFNKIMRRKWKIIFIQKN